MTKASLKDIKEEEGKLKKLLKAIKKIIAGEFLWLLFIAIISIPIALAIRYLFLKYATEAMIETIVYILEGNSILVGSYALSVVGIYFSRAIVGAIKTVVEKSES